MDREKVLAVCREIMPNYDHMPLENQDIAYHNIKQALERVANGQDFELAGFERLRRITGYLTGSLETWNDAKRAEEKARVKHGVTTVDRKDSSLAELEIKNNAKYSYGNV